MSPTHREALRARAGANFEIQVAMAELDGLNAFDFAHQVAAIETLLNQSATLAGPIIQAANHTDFDLFVGLVPATMLKY